MKIFSREDTLKLLFSGGFFTEGPAFGGDGCIYFSDLTFTEQTDMTAGILWKFNPEKGNAVVYRSPSGMSNGIEFDNNGNMIVCEGADYGGRKVTSTDLHCGKSKILSAYYKGKPYNSPNDLVIDSGNRIYFTDPRYVGHEKIEQPHFGVYRLDPNGIVTLLTKDISMPNGIAISPDEKKLYVGCNYEGDLQNGIFPIMAIYVFDINDKRELLNMKIFKLYPSEIGPDGITVDVHGNLYVALRDEINPRTSVYDIFGNQIDELRLPEIPSNLTFGKGKDNNSLFITAGGSLFKIKVQSRGKE